MDLKLVLGRSMDCFSIGQSLRDVMLAMQFVMPEVRATLLYESDSPVLNDIYIMHNVGSDDCNGARYLIEFDPFLQVVRAVNYSVSTQLNSNSLWKISGSCDIVQHRPLTAQDFISVFGVSPQAFTVLQGQVLKLLYDGACFIFELVHPITQVEDVQKVESRLTDVRLVPTKGSQFRCLIDRVLPLHSKDLSLFGIVQIGLIIEDTKDQVVGINVTFPAIQDCLSSSSTNGTAYSRRVYFGQSCQCVMTSLGSPDFVHYQQSPTVLLMLPPRSHSRVGPQQFIFNYIQFGLDIVFDIDAKQVKKFIFHSNLPDHVDVNVYNRCFYKFGISKTGFAKKGQSLLVHPGVTWSAVTNYVTESSVKFLSKLLRNDSTNAVYPHPPMSIWILFSQLICEVTASGHVATISLCALSSDQQLSILGRRDEALLVETSIQEVQNVTEEYLPSSLSSVSDSTAVCSSDVTISLPDEDGTQPRSIQHASIEVPSVEPHEESVNMSSYLSTDSSEMYHSLNNNSNQDDERGKKLSSDCIKSRLPYAYPFQAYSPIQANQISPCSNNILITMHEDTTREVHSIDQCQFIHIEMVTEGTTISTCEEASDHTLVESDKWRISCFSKEEQEAINDAEEQQAMHQQSLEENFVCDSATVTIAEQPNVVLNSDITTIGPEFEEIEYTLDPEWLMKGEEASHNDEIDKEDVTSSDPATTLPLENGSAPVSHEANDISEDVTDIRPPNSLFAEVDTFKDGSNDTEEDKQTETELVYRPQSAKVAASRTQRILQTVTSLPKKRGEYQPKKKKSNSDLVKTATTITNKSRDQKSEVIPNGAKVAKSPSAVRADHRRVHFYTEEKSKAITAKLKPKKSTEVVRRVHKDGTAYPHHHFKSDHLSALLHHGGGNVDNFPNKTPSKDMLSTFNRIFAAGDESVPKARGVVQKLNTPFATEYNSTVYSDQTADQDDQTTDQDYQTADQDDQTTSQDNKTTDQDNKIANQDRQTGSQNFQDDQIADQDNQNADQYDHIASQGNQIANQNDQTAIQVDRTTNQGTQTASHTISIEYTNKISDDFNEEMSTLIKDFFSGTSTANGCPNQLELQDATLNVTEGHGGSEEHENTSTMEELSSSNKLCSSTLLVGDANSSLVIDHSACHAPTNHNLSQGDSSNEVDNSQELTPRKQWSSAQMVQSTPDSLNQEYVTLEHLLGSHEDVCSSLLDRMEFLDHVSKCLKDGDPVSSLNLDGCEPALLADVISLLCNSDRTFSLEDTVGLLSCVKQLLLPSKTEREIDVATSLTTQVIGSHHELFKRYNEGQMRKNTIEYFHCQQCYDSLQGVAKQIEQLLNSEPLICGTVLKLQELSTSLNKLFRKLDST